MTSTSHSARFTNAFGSGSPTFLIKKLREGFHYNLSDLTIDEALFESYSIENIEYRNLLFQTGYLTIHAATPATPEDDPIYTLGYPNREVDGKEHITKAVEVVAEAVQPVRPVTVTVKLEVCETLGTVGFWSFDTKPPAPDHE